jgi:nicotinamide-nucleotide amidase
MLANTQHLLTLATELGAALKVRNMTLTLAESCTGGMAAEHITAIAGSSAWFGYGFVTYSNEAKQQLLNVFPQTLIDFGAASEQVASEMAAGALKKSDANIAASITGIAGPDGGTTAKPVGTVCFAFALNHQSNFSTSSTVQHFTGNRESIRQQSTEYALKALLCLTLSIEI